MTERSSRRASRRDSEQDDARVGTGIEGYIKDAELGSIARVLAAERGQVLSRWLALATDQPFHRARPEAAVADHIPRLYDALIQVLQRAAPREQEVPSPATDPNVVAAAQDHARVRLEQGLAPTDVATEFRLLRQETWRALREHASELADARDVLVAELLINDSIDRAITTALAALQAHEAERSRLQAELAAIVNSSYDAIVGETLDGIITSWNPAAERLYGYTAAEMIGRSTDLIIPPERPDELPAMIEHIRRGERVEPYETERVRKDGTRVVVFVTVSPIRASGQVVGASTIARDITDRKGAEQALLESEERFRTLADNMAQLAWMADPTGWIFWYNRRWFEYTGTTLDQMQGWGWTEVHHPEHVDRVLAHFRDAVERGEMWEDTFPLRGKDGRYCWFLSRAQPIRDEQGCIVRWFGTNTDVTELREAETALRRSEDERRGLLAAIAHDLKNPLANIKGLVQLLRRQADAGSLTPGRLADRLSVLVASADRMAAQLDELSLVTSGEGQGVQLTREPIDMVALVREAVAARQLGSEAHAIRVDAEPEELVGSFDATRLARVLDNLLANAVKYSPAAVDVTVEVRGVEREGQAWVRVAVRDRGMGIPADDLPHVFERFRRGRNAGTIPGSGVGLAAAREIVEAHGGTITAESREHEGSTFSVLLPLG